MVVDLHPLGFILPRNPQHGNSPKPLRCSDLRKNPGFRGSMREFGLGGSLSGSPLALPPCPPAPSAGARAWKPAAPRSEAWGLRRQVAYYTFDAGQASSIQDMLSQVVLVLPEVLPMHRIQLERIAGKVLTPVSWFWYIRVMFTGRWLNALPCRDENHRGVTRLVRGLPQASQPGRECQRRLESTIKPKN